MLITHCAEVSVWLKGILNGWPSSAASQTEVKARSSFDSTISTSHSEHPRSVHCPFSDVEVWSRCEKKGLQLRSKDFLCLVRPSRIEVLDVAGQDREPGTLLSLTLSSTSAERLHGGGASPPSEVSACRTGVEMWKTSLRLYWSAKYTADRSVLDHPTCCCDALIFSLRIVLPMCAAQKVPFFCFFQLDCSATSIHCTCRRCS